MARDDREQEPSRTTRQIVAACRALPEAERTVSGEVEAIAAVYDVRYRVGPETYERVREGAFTDSIAANPNLPIFWEHSWQRGDAPIGIGRAREEGAAIRISGRLFVDEDDRARNIYRAMTGDPESGIGPTIREWSVGMIAGKNPGEVEVHGDTEEIVRADLAETSVVLRGAQPSTETLALRSEMFGDGVSVERTRAEGLDQLTSDQVDRVLRTPWARDLARDQRESV